MLHHTPLKELCNLRWYIQHLMDESGYDYDCDDYLDNSLSEDNWMCQTRGKFLKYVIYRLHSMNHKHVKKILSDQLSRLFLIKNFFLGSTEFQIQV